MEFALETKLVQFPQLTTKENKWLYEFADIPDEIETDKENLLREKDIKGHLDLWKMRSWLKIERCENFE